MSVEEPTWLTLDDVPGRPSIQFLGVVDNGGATFDRYHAGFEVALLDEDESDRTPDTFGLDIGPTGNAPNGVCMSTDTFYEDCGEPVGWEALPEPVQRAIAGEFGLFRATECYGRVRTEREGS